MFKKFLSRKLFVVIATGIVDALIMTGGLDPEVKSLLAKLISGGSAVYVGIQGLIDLVEKLKSKFD